VEKINVAISYISTTPQHIDYTEFNKAEKITEGNYELNITYGPEHFRKKTELYEDANANEIFETNELITTRYYFGNYEKEITQTGTKEYHYISGPTGLIAVYIIENGVGELYYTITDYLGSILMLTDKDGNIEEETNYDAWGRVRNPDNWDTWTYANAQPLTKIFRGYTGHEMLPHFALINMNGRMYDPVLGRMLSPDNYIQDPTSPQCYNRYSYALNNPLVYTDPSGYWFGIDDAIVAGLGFVVGYVSYGITTGDWGIDALASGGIAAGTSWLIYNTAGAASGMLVEAGASQGSATVAGNAIGGAVGSFAGDIAGQAYYTGSIDLGQAGQSALYGFGGGMASGLVDISPLATKNFPMHHTVKHMIRSTAYEMGGNIFSGRPIFEDMTYGINPGMIVPVTMDVASLTAPKWGFRVMKNKIKENATSIFEKLNEQGFSFDSEIELEILKADVGLYDFQGEYALGLNADIRATGYLNISKGNLGGMLPISGTASIKIPHANRIGYSIYNNMYQRAFRRWW
jgi:RHS repeat-associated protein